MWIERGLVLLLAVGFGSGLQHYVNHFADNINRALHSQYQIYYAQLPQLPPQLAHEHQWLLPLVQPLRYIWLGFSLLAIGLSSYTDNVMQQVWWLYCIALLVAILLVDWHYQLISTLMCQQLLLLGLFGAWQQLGVVSLSESVQSLLWTLLFVSLFFIITKWLYQREVFGEGDCWLVTALAAFLPYSTVPWVLLLASGMGLLFAALFYFKQKQRFIPLAPSLNLAAITVYIATVQGYL